MRRLVTLFMALWLVLIPAMAQASPDQIRLVVDGVEVVSDVAPVIENGRTLVPIRALSERLGFTVAWDEATQAVSLSQGGRLIVLYIGRGEALVDGKAKPIDVPPAIRNGRTLIPVRFVAEQLGAGVTWNPETQTVGVTRSNPVSADPAVQAIWDKISEQKDGHVTVNMTMEADGTVVNVTKADVYAKGEDYLFRMDLQLPGMQMAVDGAFYQGKFWQKVPGTGWTQVEDQGLDSDLDMSKVGALGVSLEKAKVNLSQDQLNGVSMSKLTIEWQNADLVKAVDMDPAQMGEGTTTFTFWVTADGYLKQMDQVMIMTIDGVEATVRATYAAEPLTGPIPFPAEIMQ